MSSGKAWLAINASNPYHDRKDSHRPVSARLRPVITRATGGDRLSYRICRHGTPPVTSDAVTCPSKNASCTQDAYTRCTPFRDLQCLDALAQDSKDGNGLDSLTQDMSCGG